jgi:hypothetical protein
MSYRTEILADNPTAYWRLGEAAGATAAADEKAVAPGTPAGGVTFGQGGALPYDGNTAALFDGTNGKITTAYTPAFGTGAVSIEAWFKTTVRPARQYLLDFKSDATAESGMNIATNGTGQIVVKVISATTAQTLNSVRTGLDDGGWHHVVAVLERLFDGVNDRVKIYLDGVLDSTPFTYVGSAGNITGIRPVVLGTDNSFTAGTFWTGSLDEVAIYGTALTATQVAAHYANRLLQTYARWLEDPNTDRVLLADVQIREAITAWTRVGVTAAYTATWATQLQPSGANIYRRLDGVYQNQTALTLAASALLVQSTPGSYFYDATTGTLTVQTTGSLNPLTYSWVGPKFTMFVGTVGKAFGGQPLYEPRVLSNPSPVVQAQAQEPVQGIKAFPQGDLILSNADGFYDAISRTFAWEGGTVTFRFGGGNLGFGDYAVVAIMAIAKAPAAGDTQAKVQLRAVTDTLNVRFPGGAAFFPTFDSLYHPWISVAIDPTFGYNDAIRYDYMPLVFGTVRNAKAVPWAPRYNFFTARWAMQNTSGFFAPGALTLTGARAVNKTTGAVVDILNSVAYDGFEIFVSRIDYPYTDWDVYFDGTTAAQTFGAVALKMLAWAGVDVTDPTKVDAASFAQADIDAPAPLGIHVPSGTTTITLGELIEQLERSVLGRVYKDQGTGIWKAAVWSPANDYAAVPVFLEGELADFSPDAVIAEILASGVVVSYNPDASGLSASPTKTYQDGYAAGALNNSNQLTVDTKLAREADAQTMAWRYGWIASSSVLRVKTRTSPRAMNLDVWARGRFTRGRAPNALGRWADTILEIAEFTKTLADGDVQITLTDQRGVGEGVKMSAPNGTADWDTASTVERRTYAFSHDNTTERVDTADATTFHHSMGW